MSGGFFKVAFVAEHYGNSIVNVLHFRSHDWAWNTGNPFDDVQATLEAVYAELGGPWLSCHNQDTRLLRLEGVGYDDAYNIVTASPLVKTVDLPGTRNSNETTGSFISANVGLRCGEQVQINNIGKSKRNRGYLSIGPIGEADVDAWGHLSLAVTGLLDDFAQHLDNTITMLAPATQLVPVRVHEKWIGVLGKRVLEWRTYSDVLGYTVPRSAAVRRSRMSEA